MERLATLKAPEWISTFQDYGSSALCVTPELEGLIAA